MSDIREANGHSLRVIRAQHDLTLAELSQAIHVSVATLSRIENGLQHAGPDTRRRLAKYFNKSSLELGLIGPDKKDAPIEPEKPELKLLPKEGPTIVISRTHAIDALTGAGEQTPEQQLGAWLALEAAQIGQLFDAGWTTEGILDSLRVVLQGVQSMPKVNRRKLLELGGAAVMTSISLPVVSRVSEEERVQLCEKLGKSIATSWKLFHTTSIPKVLAVSQAQLFLVQQSDSSLYPSVRPLLYGGVYQLIGASFYFLGKYEEARKAFEKSYIAGYESASAWNIAQSLSWQAYIYEALGQNQNAVQTVDGALQVISQRDDQECIRLRARLYAFSAENTSLMRQIHETERRLHLSESFLERLPATNEEFDRVSWLQHAGTCATSLGRYTLAVEQLQEALNQLPSQWLLRSIATSLPLATALLHTKQLQQSLHVARRALRDVVAVQSQVTTQRLVTYLHNSSTNFAGNIQYEEFVHEAKQQLALSLNV